MNSSRTDYLARTISATSSSATRCGCGPTRIRISSRGPQSKSRPQITLCGRTPSSSLRLLGKLIGNSLYSLGCVKSDKAQGTTHRPARGGRKTYVQDLPPFFFFCSSLPTEHLRDASITRIHFNNQVTTTPSNVLFWSVVDTLTQTMLKILSDGDDTLSYIHTCFASTFVCDRQHAR